MKVAMPVKTAKADTVLSPFFGHAKYFAFIEEGKRRIVSNPHDGGVSVAEWLLDEGVDLVITQHIGLKPFALLAYNGVQCFYPGEGRITIDDAIDLLQRGHCEPITEQNIDKFIRHNHNHHHH